MKYKIIPIALGMKIASSVHITYRICRRFASPQMYPNSATQATTNRNIPYTHSACPQRMFLIETWCTLKMSELEPVLLSGFR